MCTYHRLVGTTYHGRCRTLGTVHNGDENHLEMIEVARAMLVPYSYVSYFCNRAVRNAWLIWNPINAGTFCPTLRQTTTIEATDNPADHSYASHMGIACPSF